MVIFQCDRVKLVKEKQLKEEVLREKVELERKLLQMQEEVRIVQEMLVSDKEKKCYLLNSRQSIEYLIVF